VRNALPLSTAIVLALAMPAHGALSDFLEGYYTTPDGFGMPYRLYVPSDYDPSVNYPLTLYMHGAGQVGSNNTSQIGTQANTLLSHVKTPQYTSLLLCPQTPGTWGDWSTPVVTGMIEEIMTQYSVDRSRLYATGYSLGGSGVWTQISNQPDYFAAAVPIAGEGFASRAYRMTEQNLWAFHGEADATVSVNKTRVPIDAIRQLGGDPLYTEYAGAGHGISGLVLNDADMYDWMFAQRGEGQLLDSLPSPLTPNLRYEKIDLGNGLIGYRFYIYNEVYLYANYNLELAFRGVDGATIHQVKYNGMAPVTTEEMAELFDGTGSPPYDKDLDSWIIGDWDLMPGMNRFTGTGFNGIVEGQNMFEAGLYSDPNTPLWTGVDVAYVVADGDVEWAGQIGHLRTLYDAAGVTPEPATMALLAFGAAALIRRR